MKLPLVETQEATVPASGVATVTIGPSAHGEVWELDGQAVMVSSANSEPTGELRLNGRFLFGTYVASRNSSGRALRLQSGDKLSFVWTGADVGATATLTVTGFKYLPG